MAKSVYLLVGLLFAPLLVLAAPVASADSCSGHYSVGIGGWGSGDSSMFTTVDQKVIYNSWTDPDDGLAGLDRIVTGHRAQCPADHITEIGYSEGAALVHVWETTHPNFARANAILLADLKRAAGPGSAGVMSIGGAFGYPLSGVDADFGTIPTLSVCNGRDGMCNAIAGPIGYTEGAHADYDFDVRHYSDSGKGVRFR